MCSSTALTRAERRSSEGVVVTCQPFLAARALLLSVIRSWWIGASIHSSKPEPRLRCGNFEGATKRQPREYIELAPATRVLPWFYQSLDEVAHFASPALGVPDLLIQTEAPR